MTARSAVMDIQAKLRARLVGQKKEAKDVKAAPVDERDSASIYADLRAKQAASASKEQVASTPRTAGKRTKDTGTGKGTTDEGGVASAGAGGGAGAGSSGGKKRPRPTRDDSSTTGTDAGRSKKPRALDIEAALAKLVKHLVRLVFCQPRFVVPIDMVYAPRGGSLRTRSSRKSEGYCVNYWRHTSTNPMPACSTRHLTR